MRPAPSTPTLRAAATALAAVWMLVAPGAPHEAQAQMAPAPVVHVGAQEQTLARRIDLSIGKSIVVDLPRDAKEVFVANPKVANAVVRSTRKVFLIGMADGATSIFVMDAEGRQIAALEIAVGRDLNILRQTLRTAMPQARIDIKPAGDSVLLTGSVASASEAQQAVDIANAFVGQDGTAGGGSGVAGKVINALTIRGKDQVMLKVTVAEIQRNVLKQLGINTFGSWEIGKLGIAPLVENPFSVAGQALAGTILKGGLGFDPGAPPGSPKSVPNATIQAMERAGVMRTLAEPNLTAISGETATFLVGGEVPILAGYQCSGPGGTNCTQTVEFKKFGVALTFTPIVLSEGRISVRVATEVSEIDTENSVRYDRVSIPGFKVRRSETTVELPSGGTLATAGLIQQASRAAINGFPGLMNVPILGTLFRSRDYQRQETELMISVTPYIAKAMNPGQVTRPDDGFVEANDPQGVFLGRINKIYGVASAPPPGAAYRGRIGFIND